VSGQEFVMQDLRLIGVQDDGEHLLLAGPDGAHYRLALDEALRAAARRDRPRLGQLQIESEGGMRPREVQSLIRAGATAEEVADRARWTVEKVRRYEVPILAERVHIAQQARQVRVRTRGASYGAGVPTLQGRVAQRMRERGVDPEGSAWDSWREVEETHWTVVLTFAAGGRQRQASWTYDPVLRTVEALDDEARWLSADEPAEMGPLPTVAPRVSSVYDVEAEGGVAATPRRPGTARPSPEEEPLDLMTAMRQRTTVGRRSGRRRSASAEPARRPVAPALPLDEQPAVSPSVEPEVPVARVAEETVEAPVEARVEPPVENVVEGGDGEEVEAEEPPSARVLEDAVGLEPAGAETPPLDDETAEAAEPVADGPAEEPPPEVKSASRRRQRPSVPSWDDIMFGAKRD
jgi:hypothetical protein